jgi:hypothetical protein
VHHDDDVATGLQGQAVAGLLIGPVAAVDLVAVDAYAVESLRQLDGVIAAGIVDQDALVDVVLLDDLPVGLVQGP